MLISKNTLVELIMTKTLYVGDSLTGDVTTSVLLKDITKSDFIDIIDSLYTGIYNEKMNSKSKRFIVEIDMSVLDDISSYLISFLTDDMLKDYTVFLKVLEFIVNIIKLSDKKCYYELSMDNDGIYLSFNKIFYEKILILLSKFNFESFRSDELKIIEGFLIDNYDILSIEYIFHSGKHLRSKKDGSIRRLLPEIVSSMKFSKEFILENYEKLTPWVILKNSNLPAEENVYICIFGKMTETIMNEILEYTTTEDKYRNYFKISNEEALMAALKYNLLKEGN